MPLVKKFLTYLPITLIVETDKYDNILSDR